MRLLPRIGRQAVGAQAPGAGALSPSLLLVGVLLAAPLSGCGSKDETRTLEPVQLGMSSDMAPIYDDDQMQLYEVKLPVGFPIKAPTAAEQANLDSQPVAPYPSKLWVEADDYDIQITWTLSNLDAEDHNVELLVDPWNEFGRYWPGMEVTDAQRGELQPNLSGIDVLFELPGTKGGRESRRHGTLTVQDMKELAIDFGTVMNIIANAPPPDPNAPDEDPTVTLVNHAFAVGNRSYNDPLSKPYIPGVIAGLTGVDIGMRTREPANVALEIVIEVVDKGDSKVISRDSKDAPIPEPADYVTVAYGGAM